MVISIMRRSTSGVIQPPYGQQQGHMKTVAAALALPGLVVGAPLGAALADNNISTTQTMPQRLQAVAISGGGNGNPGQSGPRQFVIPAGHRMMGGSVETGNGITLPFFVHTESSALVATCKIVSVAVNDGRLSDHALSLLPASYLARHKPSGRIEDLRLQSSFMSNVLWSRSDRPSQDTGPRFSHPSRRIPRPAGLFCSPLHARQNRQSPTIYSRTDRVWRMSD